jgi:hypothetical protein
MSSPGSSYSSDAITSCVLPTQELSLPISMPLNYNYWSGTTSYHDQTPLNPYGTFLNNEAVSGTTQNGTHNASRGSSFTYSPPPITAVIRSNIVVTFTTWWRKATSLTMNYAPDHDLFAQVLHIAADILGLSHQGYFPPIESVEYCHSRLSVMSATHIVHCNDG